MKQNYVTNYVNVDSRKIWKKNKTKTNKVFRSSLNVTGVSVTFEHTLSEYKKWKWKGDVLNTKKQRGMQREQEQIDNSS